ncbi:hypothetical protein GSI_03106 [Ganoderma sinense ZZ0214-1]|uniref:Uncharacterized protein n=1 Tax=Ganoderma sinense ZZ0214-1 TaxID=1077348 RepID=A0A2G8SKP6_9APHY|nr:hypothetical protein GSI_03106 [Ganoderma sinense ZZ0214-1]
MDTPGPPTATATGPESSPPERKAGKKRQIEPDDSSVGNEGDMPSTSVEGRVMRALPARSAPLLAVEEVSSAPSPSASEDVFNQESIASFLDEFTARNKKRRFKEPDMVMFIESLIALLQANPSNMTLATQIEKLLIDNGFFDPQESGSDSGSDDAMEDIDEDAVEAALFVDDTNSTDDLQGQDAGGREVIINPLRDMPEDIESGPSESPQQSSLLAIPASVTSTLDPQEEEESILGPQSSLTIAPRPNSPDKDANMDGSGATDDPREGVRSPQVVDNPAVPAASSMEDPRVPAFAATQPRPTDANMDGSGATNCPPDGVAAPTPATQVAESDVASSSFVGQLPEYSLELRQIIDDPAVPAFAASQPGPTPTTTPRLNPEDIDANMEANGPCEDVQLQQVVNNPAVPAFASAMEDPRVPAFAASQPGPLTSAIPRSNSADTDTIMASDRDGPQDGVVPPPPPADQDAEAAVSRVKDWAEGGDATWPLVVGKDQCNAIINWASERKAQAGGPSKRTDKSTNCFSFSEFAPRGCPQSVSATTGSSAIFGTSMNFSFSPMTTTHSTAASTSTMPVTREIAGPGVEGSVLPVNTPSTSNAPPPTILLQGSSPETSHPPHGHVASSSQSNQIVEDMFESTPIDVDGPLTTEPEDPRLSSDLHLDQSEIMSGIVDSSEHPSPSTSRALEKRPAGLEMPPLLTAPVPPSQPFGTEETSSMWHGTIAGTQRVEPLTRSDFVDFMAGISGEIRTFTNTVTEVLQARDGRAHNRGDNIRGSGHGPTGNADIPEEDGDADDESDIAEVCNVKKKRLTRHRNSKQVQLTNDVTKHALSLLRRDNKKAPFPADTVASAVAVGGFRPEEAECCSAESFCLDFANTPASNWNTSATKVFVRDFLSVGQYECRNSAAIEKMFIRHFRTLKKHYLKQVEDQRAAANSRTVDRTPINKAHARYQRKYNMFQRRLRAALRYQETRRHVRLLQAVGPDGMSSDEEDDSSVVVKKYGVLKKAWRSDVLVKLLRILDALHRRHRKEGQGSRQGQLPRTRYLTDKGDDTRRPCAGLPRSAYNVTWLATLTPIQLEDLRIDEREHDMTCSHAIMK